MSFYTVEKQATGEYCEKKSKFMAVVFRVETKAEAEEIIAKVKKEHHDARHNVYAYTLDEGNFQKYSDDGEPSGTAGQPILDILKAGNIKNCLIVVTRYFGGILLGTGGLVRSYTNAANDALSNAGLCEITEALRYNVSTDYSMYNSLLNFFGKFTSFIEDTVFLENITVTFCIKKTDRERFEKAFTEKFNNYIPLGECEEVLLGDSLFNGKV